MTISIKRPILVAGVSLSFLLWLWQSVQSHVTQIMEYSIWILILIAIVWSWWKPKNWQNNSQKFILNNVTEEKLTSVIQDTGNLIDSWEAEKKALISKQKLSENNLLLIAENKSIFLDKLSQIKRYYLDNKNLQIALISSNKLRAYTLEKII